MFLMAMVLMNVIIIPAPKRAIITGGRLFNTLYKAGYNRPLMFEFQYKDIGDLKPCYNFYITGYLSKSNHILNSQSASHD